MTTYPIQRQVIERLHGLTCAPGALAEHFEIPFDGPFDIVIVPHVFVHAADPAQLFAEIRRVIAPRGWVYLCEEPDDRRLFNRGKNLFSELKCFHFQQVDEAAYGRALALQGFSVAASGPKEPGKPSAEMFALGRLSKKAKFDPMTDAELTSRRSMYQRWRDESILSLPENARAMFAEEMPDIVKRAIAGGYAEEAKDGQVKTSREIYMVYGAGYSKSASIVEAV